MKIYLLFAKNIENWLRKILAKDISNPFDSLWNWKLHVATE